MSFLSRYSQTERPVAQKVLMDLAMDQFSVFQQHLRGLVHGFPGDGVDHAEAREIVVELRAAERLLGMAVGLDGPRNWPWVTNDFEDFWDFGGNGEEAASMMEYVERMPDYIRIVVEAESMPADYAQPLLDGIPRWHN